MKINSGSGKDFIEIEANFLISPKIKSGAGRDRIDLVEANAAFVNLGQGNNSLWLGRDRWEDLDELDHLLEIKDVIFGGGGKDRFIFNTWNDDAEFAYDLNGDDDFCVIKDYQAKDKLVVCDDADYRIGGTNGIVDLTATGAYKAQSVSYTARLYADDDLIAYICGFEPTLADLTLHL